MAAANIVLSEQSPGKWVLELSGNWSGEREDALSAALGRASAAGAAWIGLDFGAVTCMDGSGLTLLLLALFWTRTQGQRLALLGLAPRCRRLFTELGLDAAFSLIDAEAGASRELCGEREWAGSLGRVPKGTVGNGPLRSNVEGRAVATPLNGFGELWHKVYRLSLAGCGCGAAEVAAHCKAHLGELWPPGNHLDLGAAGLVPGAAGHILLRLPGGVPLSTGIRVLHVGAQSFTFVTLAGHMEAGWITFRAAEEGGAPVLWVESLARTGDPLYELGFQLFGHGQQEAFWQQTLQRLAEHYRVPARIQVRRSRVDASRNWEAAGNLAANAGVRTGAAVAGALAGRVLGRLLGAGKARR